MMEQPEFSGSNGSGDGAGDGDIYRLPEECISQAIVFTSPTDACRSAAVSTRFRSAAAADVVWGRFLPSDYEAILALAVRPVEYSSKRELFFRLCDHPVLIDDGNMSFSLDESTGAKCFMLSAWKLSIIWGSTPKYWRWNYWMWNHLPDARFADELLDVRLLQIHGKIESNMLSRKTNYAAFFIYKLNDEAYGLSRPYEATVKLGANSSTNMVCLQPMVRSRMKYPYLLNIHGNEEETAAGIRTPRTRNDGLMEMELGEFYNDDGEDGEVEVSLMEVKELNSKKGLSIHGIEIRPKPVA